MGEPRAVAPWSVFEVAPCPTCGAAPNERCRTKSGRRPAAFSHVARRHAVTPPLPAPPAPEEADRG